MIVYERLCSICFVLLIPASVLAQSEFLVTPSPALEVSFPGQEGYQYQVSSSTNLQNWTPATELRVSCGSLETFTFGVTNHSHAFYRAQSFPPDLTKRIVGMRSVAFDNTTFQSDGQKITISGIRTESRDYNLNDYIKATFLFDLCKQGFSLSSLQVFTNVGVICGQSPSYYMKDATNRLTMTNGTALMNADTVYSLSTTGQVLSVRLGIAQVLAFYVTALPVTTAVILTDPEGHVMINDTWQSGLDWYTGSNGGLLPGVYKLRLIPQGNGSATLSFRFHNDNSHALKTLTSGKIFSTFIGPYVGDYDKFKIQIKEGQTLQLTQPGDGANIDVFNSLGVPLFSRGGQGTVFFPAPKNDTYYVVYWHNDLGGSHSYSTTVRLTP